MQSSYQEFHFDEIADAIRYVDGTTEENDQIVALDFAKRIRAHKGQGGGGTGVPSGCRLADNIPDGCGEDHGLLHLDYTLVNVVTEKIVDNYRTIGPNSCLCDDDWGYGPPSCKGIHGMLLLDYAVGEPVQINQEVLWGWEDAGN